MKGKISVLLLFLLMSLLLVGCEDLSTFTTTGSETPTTTESSTPVTTTAPATGVTTTAPATGVTTTVPATGVTTTVPATTVSTGFFDRSLLVGAIIAMDGSGEMTEAEAEEQIGMMTMILGVSEAELYAMVLEAPTMISGLQTIETLADFQLWYAEAKTIMSKQMLTDAMMNVIQMMSAQVVDDPQTEYLQQEIDDVEDDLANALAQLAAVRSGVVTYGNTNTTNGASVVAYYDAIVAREEANSIYYQAVDDYFYDRSWEEYDEYNQLKDYIWDYYYYLYDYVDTELANQAITNYNNLLASFSTENQAAYGALIELYAAYLMCQFATVPLAEEEIAGLQDTVTEEMVTSVLNDDYLSEYYNWSSEVNTYEWVLIELQYELEQAEAMLAFMELFVAYLGTVDGATTLKLVVIDLYDLADALIVNLDEDVFNLIFGMLFNYAPLGGDLLDEMSGIQMLLGYIDELSAILTTIQTEMDTEAIGHLSDLLKDVATIYVQSLDLPVAEETAMLAVILPKIDEYLGIADEIFDELVGFLQTVDEDKIAAITAFIEMMIPEDEQDPVVFMSVHDESEMIFILVEVAKLAQALIGDESLDLSMIVDHLVTIYFDVEYDFQPDPDQVTLIRGLVIENLETMLGMVDEIALIDAENVAFEDMMLIQEFVERAEAFADIFRYGFEVAEEWVFGIQHEDVLEFVVDMFGNYDMTEVEAEALLDDLIVLFDVETEEDLYFMMVGMMFHMSSLPYLTTYDDLVAWYDYFETVGMTNQKIAEILVDMLEFQMEREASGEGGYSYDIAWRQDSILENEEDILMYIGLMDNLSDLINDELIDGGFETAEIDLFMDYWDARVLMAEYQADYWRLEEEIRWSDNPAYDEDNFWTVMNTLNDVFWGYETQANFDAIFAALPQEEQDLYQPLITLVTLKHNHDINTLGPLETQIYEAEIYNSMLWIADSAIYDYNEYYNETLYLTDEIGWYQEEILKLQDEIAFAGEMATYLAVLENKQRIIDVILIGFDELENLMTGLDNPTVDLLIQFLMSQSYDYEGEPVVIDQSPEAIVGYLDDLLPIISGLLSTIDSVDQLKIKTLIMDIAEMRLPYEGMPTEEVTAVLDLINVAFDKYFPRIQEIVDIFVAALDGLDVATIQTIVDLITDISEEDNPSTAQAMVTLMTIVDILTYAEGVDPLLDWETLLDYFVEGYYDVMYMFDYLTVDMEATQDILFAITTDMLDLAHQVAAVDLEAVAAADLELLYNVYIYMGTLAQADNLEEVVHPAELTPFDPLDYYSYSAFNDLIQEHNDWMLEPGEVTAEVARLTAHYGATTELEAYLYTLLFGYVYEELPM